MDVRLLADADEARWDAYVDAHADGTFFHRAAWARVIRESFGHRTPYLLALEGNDVQGVLPLTEIRSRLFGRSLISNAFCVYGGPLASSAEAAQALDDAAWRIARTSGIDVLEYRSRTRRHTDWAAKDNVYATFRKAIAADHDANMKAIPRKQRAMVRKGIERGLSSEVDATVDRFFAMYAESVRNLGTPVFAKRYFANLLRAFGKDCDIVTISHDGQAVSAVMNFYFRDEVLPYYGGGTTAARALAANDFMYWEVMRRAVEDRGARLFDFGRSKVGTGAFSFKKNWGFEPTPLEYEYKLAPGVAVPDVNPLNPKYRLMVATWQRLPLWLANRLGPLIARDLG
ncbi:MAG: FemAB family PEP-CTERM system-associated protein [Sphingomonadales bacterium]|nr:FemAB family PEP-CTERM system-associated protein [Sphingomonadales bacterium]